MLKDIFTQNLIINNKISTKPVLTSSAALVGATTSKTRAIKDKIKATFQLMPINNDGYPVNVTGNIAQLANSNRYLITNQNVSYVVNFDQIRYIANL